MAGPKELLFYWMMKVSEVNMSDTVVRGLYRCRVSGFVLGSVWRGAVAGDWKEKCKERGEDYGVESSLGEVSTK